MQYAGRDVPTDTSLHLGILNYILHLHCMSNYYNIPGKVDRQFERRLLFRVKKNFTLLTVKGIEKSICKF